MIEKSDAASIFRDTRGRGSIKISVPGTFTAVGFSSQQKNPGASAAERGRPSLFKTIDEDRRARHDHINRSGRSTYPEEKSVQTTGTTAMIASAKFVFPPVDVISSIFAPAEALIRKREQNDRESQTLASIRDLVLPKLMSGEIRVKDVEKIAVTAL